LLARSIPVVDPIGSDICKSLCKHLICINPEKVGHSVYSV